MITLSLQCSRLFQVLGFSPVLPCAWNNLSPSPGATPCSFPRAQGGLHWSLRIPLIPSNLPLIQTRSGFRSLLCTSLAVGKRRGQRGR